jgi:hypothetical protein
MSTIPVGHNPTGLPRTCKLQINQAGAWRDVVRFDADQHGDAIQQHAPLLAAVVGATLRIVIADSLNNCLLRWSIDTGWVVA